MPSLRAKHFFESRNYCQELLYLLDIGVYVTATGAQFFQYQHGSFFRIHLLNMAVKRKLAEIQAVKSDDSDVEEVPDGSDAGSEDMPPPLKCAMGG